MSTNYDSVDAMKVSFSESNCPADCDHRLLPPEIYLACPHSVVISVVAVCAPVVLCVSSSVVAGAELRLDHARRCAVAVLVDLSALYPYLICRRLGIPYSANRSAADSSSALRPTMGHQKTRLYETSSPPFRFTEPTTHTPPSPKTD